MTNIVQETLWSSALVNDHDNWIAKLSYAEYEAVSYYIEHGHKKINSTLRSNQVDDIIRALDSALANNVNRTSGVFYRGCDYFSDDNQVGDIFSSRTFFSTSANPFEAMKFAGDISPVLFRITSKMGGQSIVSDKNEQEILFPRNTEFVITNIIRDTSLKLYYSETDYFVSYQNVTLVNMSQK